MAKSYDEEQALKITDKGERQKAFYTAQRKNAEGRANADADSATTAAKINSKLGKKDAAASYTEKASRTKKAGVLGSAVNLFSDTVKSNQENEMPGGPAAKIASTAAKTGSKLALNAGRQFLGKAVPVAEKAGSALASKAGTELSGLIPKAEKMAGDGINAVESFFGKTKSLPKARNSTMKAAELPKARTKASKASELPAAKAETRKAVKSDEISTKGTGRAKSSPRKRNDLISNRVNPKTEQFVGKNPADIVKRAAARANKRSKAKTKVGT